MGNYIRLLFIFSFFNTAYALEDFKSGYGNSKFNRIESIEKYITKMNKEYSGISKKSQEAMKKDINDLKTEMKKLSSSGGNEEALKVLEDRINKLEVRHTQDMNKINADFRKFKQDYDQALMDLSKNLLQRIQIFEKYISNMGARKEI